MSLIMQKKKLGNKSQEEMIMYKKNEDVNHFFYFHLISTFLHFLFEINSEY